MAEVQELKVRITAQDDLTDKMKKAQKELDNFADSAKNAESGLNAGSNSAGDFTEALGGLNIKAVLSTVATAKVAKMVLDFANSCMEASTQVRQLNNLMDFTFKEGATEVHDFAQALGEVYGMSYKDAAGSLTQFTQLGESIGLAKQDATELAKSLTKLGAEYEVAFGQGAQALSAFEGAIKGNYRGLQSIGIILNETKLEAVAASMGITSQVSAWNEATRAAVVYQAIMAETAGVGEMAANNTNSWAVQTAQLSNEVTTFLAGIGEVLETIFTPVIWLLTAVMKVLNAFFGFSSSLSAPTQQIAINTGQITNNLLSAGKAMGAVDSGANSLNKNLGGANKAAQQLKRTLLGFDEMNVLSDNGSIGSIGGLGDLSVATPDFSGIMSALDGLMGKYGEAETAISNFATNSSISQDALVQRAIEDAQKMAMGLDTTVTAAEVAAWELWGAENSMKAAFDALPEDVKKALEQANINSGQELIRMIQFMEASGQTIEETFGDHSDEIIKLLQNAGIQIEEDADGHHTHLYDGQLEYLKQAFDIQDDKQQDMKDLNSQWYRDMLDQADDQYREALLQTGAYWEDNKDVAAAGALETATGVTGIEELLNADLDALSKEGIGNLVDDWNKVIDGLNALPGMTRIPRIPKPNGKADSSFMSTLAGITSTFSNWTSNLILALQADNATKPITANISSDSLNRWTEWNSQIGYYTKGTNPAGLVPGYPGPTTLR